MSNSYSYPTIDLLKVGLAERGYQHEALLLNRWPYSRFTSPAGASWLTSNFRITYPFISSCAKEISKDKLQSYALADSTGATIPYTLGITPGEDLENIWDTAGKFAPLVVKPASATLSRGLTVNVRDIASLLAAVEKAREFSDDVIIQQQVNGQEVRIAVIDGVCKAVILRQTPRLVGDGRKNIKELLEQENAERAAIRLPYVTYPLLGSPIIDIPAARLDHVLHEGEILELSKSSMIRGGASAYNISDEIHESYKQAAVDLANAVGRGFVGVDLLIEDYRLPLTEKNYAFLEYNMSPNLLVFYGCRDGNQYDIVKDLAAMIDANLHRV